ncbi:MAG: hypothetical protein AB7O45_08580 [Alphaproteobacteria bacterium]
MARATAPADSFPAVFDALKSRLRRHAGDLAVLTDRPGRYEVTGRKPYHVTSLRTGRAIAKRDAYFAGIVILRGHVGFYFMPACASPGFMDQFSPAMRKRLKGKSCFHFRRPEEVDDELDRMIVEGRRAFEKIGLI